jgi:glycerol-3-phosphate dehydrogenase
VSATHDVIVVGAGILGAGILQAAAARGHAALGLEARGVAAGTSSRSSKLIHGGLRYLETGQLGLVRESLRERRTLLRIAPHLVRLEDFHIPVARGARRGPFLVRAGLSLYALLGDLRPASRFRSLPRREWEALDGMRTDDLRAVFRYRDGRTDDAALTRAVVASAESLGAELRCPAELVHAERRGGLHHVVWRSGAGEERAAAPALVLAAGPWTNEARARCAPSLPPLPLDLVQGSHIEVPGTLARGIYYVESPIDRRPVFVMPWRDRILVGTTETPRVSPEECAPTDAETEYLLAALRHRFPERTGEVLARWSGLRVLRRATGDANRRSREVVQDSVLDDGAILLTVAGGKLTGYRAIAAAVLRTLERVLPRRAERARTETSRLPE